MHHVLESAGGVGAVLPGQTAVLFIDELQLGQTFLYLTLKGLQHKTQEFKGNLKTKTCPFI